MAESVGGGGEAQWVLCERPALASGYSESAEYTHRRRTTSCVPTDRVEEGHEIQPGADGRRRPAVHDGLGPDVLCGRGVREGVGPGPSGLEGLRTGRAARRLEQRRAASPPTRATTHPGRASKPGGHRHRNSTHLLNRDVIGPHSHAHRVRLKVVVHLLEVALHVGLPVARGTKKYRNSTSCELRGLPSSRAPTARFLSHISGITIPRRESQWGPRMQRSLPSRGPGPLRDAWQGRARGWNRIARSSGRTSIERHTHSGDERQGGGHS